MTKKQLKNPGRGNKERVCRGTRPESIEENFVNFTMADIPAQAILNEAALKRFDPYVKEILDTAKFVALHTFNTEEDEWEKTNVEGSLFVYSRTGEPYYNILVLNRLNTTNLIEPINSKLDLQLHDSFLIYRNTKLCIYGIWFYEKEECTRLAALIQKLMKKSSGNKQIQNNLNSNSGSNSDLYSMLSKAQEEYNSAKMLNNRQRNARVESQETDQTPQSVMDFFAKAGSAPQTTTVPAITAPRTVLGRAHSLNTAENNSKTPLNPLIHQLMSNPVHTVEHIEKQQRSITPQMGEVPNNDILKKLMMGSNNQDNELIPVLEESTKKTNKPDNSVNGFNFLRISSPNYSLLSKPAAESTNIGSLPGSKTPMATPQKPALMPPAMFTPSSAKEPLSFDPVVNVNEYLQEPMTKSQLLQAMYYLLKNDPDFLTKLHGAYLKSLTDKVL